VVESRSAAVAASRTDLHPLALAATPETTTARRQSKAWLSTRRASIRSLPRSLTAAKIRAPQRSASSRELPAVWDPTPQTRAARTMILSQPLATLTAQRTRTAPASYPIRSAALTTSRKSRLSTRSSFSITPSLRRSLSNSRHWKTPNLSFLTAAKTQSIGRTSMPLSASLIKTSPRT